MKQHKWHKEIKAWADGAVIQTDISEVKEEPIWIDVHSPAWDINDEYRIKPQPKKPEYLYVYLADEGYHLSRLNPYESKYMKREQVECIGKVRIEPIE